MNSAFMLWVPFLLGCASAVGTGLLLARFGKPVDTVRFLAFLTGLIMTGHLLINGLAPFGIYPIFWYDRIYSVSEGLLAFSLPAYVFLGVLDYPTQIQRKIMWRLPLIGAMLGHLMGNQGGTFLLLAGEAVSLALLLWKRKTEATALRLFFWQLAFLVLQVVFWRSGQHLMGMVFVALWTWTLFRLLDVFLVKNLVRGALA